MEKFDFEDEICFRKAIFYNFHPIPLWRKFKDATGGMGNNAPEQGCIELYDEEGYCANLTVTRGFVKNIIPMILNGKSMSFNKWRESLYWKIRNQGHQSSTACELGMLDILMLDLLAKRNNKPLHRFLGATKNWASAYKGGGSILLEDSELVEEMVRFKEEGYDTVKFKVGSSNNNHDKDLLRIEKVRKALGKDIAIAVDANQKWSVDEAYEFATLAKPYNLAWLEEPIHAHNMNGIKELKDRGVPMDISFGESMRISYAYETYIEKGVDHLQPSVGRMSRIDDLLKIRKMAHENNITFSSGGRVYLNSIFGCLYNENEKIEYHEPISRPIGEYTLYKPEEKSGRFYCQDDVIGNPQRMDLEKLEKDGLLESKKIYYTN
ncbi:MAG: enolase C-terminal domain-like protein [Lachnospirales bacterium]